MDVMSREGHAWRGPDFTVHPNQEDKWFPCCSSSFQPRDVHCGVALQAGVSGHHAHGEENRIVASTLCI